MTYIEALNSLDGLSQILMDIPVLDPPQRTYYCNVIDTIRQLLIMQREPCANCPNIPVRVVRHDNKTYCGACGKRIPLKIKANYCHKCGREINWLP